MTVTDSTVFSMLKECYEIVNEARPLSGFPPEILSQKYISNHETK